MWRTPGIFSAAEVSMSLMRACGCGEVRNFTYSRSGNHTRLAYCALPVNLGMATSGIGGSGLPNNFRFSGGYPCHFLVTRLARSLDYFVTRQVAAAGRIVPHHRHLDANHRIGFGLHFRLAPRAIPPPTPSPCG